MSDSNGNGISHGAKVIADKGSLHGYFGSLQATLEKLPTAQVQEIVDVLMQAYDAGTRIFLFGNGGSASLASHFVCDLNKGTTERSEHSKRFRAICLTDNVPMLTAWANDSAYAEIFSAQLSNLIAPNDIAFAISGSGNSANVLRGLRTARAAGAICVGLTGYQGGQMKSLCDLCVIVPSDNMQVIEDIHLSIAHAIFTAIRCQLEDRLPLTASLSVAQGH